MTDLWLITAYCLCTLCTRQWHGLDRTALGSKPVPGYTIACPKELPFGSVLLIEGVGVRWCEDRGSGITGQHVDVLLSDHETAKRFTRQAKVTLLHLGEPRGTR